MKKIYKNARWIFSGACLFAVGGCVTEQQAFDFVRTEIARIVSDTVGQVFTILVQATT